VQPVQRQLCRIKAESKLRVQIHNREVVTGNGRVDTAIQAALGEPMSFL
jgi:hypothetical protein